MDYKIQHKKDVNSVKIYRFNEFLIIPPERFFVDLDKLLLKFI